MNLYLVRHADAGSRQEWAGDDAERPVSPVGRRQAQALAAAFRERGILLDAVIASPLVRTRQTAEELLPVAADGAGVQFNELLAPGQLRRRKLSKFLAGLGAKSVAVVGHDPDLPEYLAWLLGTDPEQVHLEKGGVALVRFEDTPGKGEGVLAWMVTPEWFMIGPKPAG
jgi:phosphohistidine phosphatase SixA